MRFNQFVQYLEKLEATSKRLEMFSILSECFKEADKGEIRHIVYFCQEQLLPPFYAMEIGMAESMMRKAIVSISGRKEEEIKALYKKKGDLGLVAEEINEKGSSKGLSINDVYEHLLSTAKITGKGSVDEKVEHIASLLKRCDPKESKYVIRFVMGRLRLGIGDPTIMDSMSKAISGDRIKLREDIEKAYNLCSDLGLVGEELFKKGDKGLKGFKAKVGNPIRMAAAERLPSAEEIIGKMGKCAVEKKYDGFRCVGGYTSIYVKEKGILPAREVQVGDHVLTHNGRFKRVLAKKKRVIDREERIFRLQTYLGDQFKVTEKHPLLCRIKNKLDWIGVENIPKDAEMVFPIPKLTEIKLPSELKLQTISGYKKTFRLNKNFYRFLGYWIGDGYSNEYNATNRIGLIFNAKTEKELCEEYKNVIAKEFGITRFGENLHNGAIYLYWEDKPLLQWLSQNFRQKWKNGWKGKTLPEWFASVSKENFLAFLQGWIEADGHTDELGRTAVVTKEASLAAMAQLIALKFKRIIGLKKLRINGADYYKLVITKNDRRARIADNTVFVKIFKKEELSRHHPRGVDPRQVVYNFQVEEDESYCSPMCTLHNCQIHKDHDKVEIFSRNLERMTPMFPDIVKAVKSSISAKTAILEGEAVAYNEDTGELFPFQVTITRKRKYDIEEKAKEKPLVLFAFDLLYVDGKDITKDGYEERRKTLVKLIKKGFTIRESERIVTDDPKELEKYFEESVALGSEGIMAKRLDAPYEAGKRGFNWIKLKRSYRGELADTIDIVLIGYFRGRGMRAEFGIGALLGAVYNEKTDSFESIAKIGSGLSEEKWVEIRKLLDAEKVSKKPARVESGVIPDVWTAPKYVFTVMADEITPSPMHAAGRVGDKPGFALRFPRIQSWIREDKKPEDATTVKEIAEMFKMQKRVKAVSFGK